MGALFKMLPWKWIGIGLAILATVLGVFFAGFDAGVKSEQAAQLKRNEAAIRAATKQTKAGDKISAAAGKETVRVEKQIEWRTRTIVQKVPEYVTVAGDNRCVVPRGFVQLYNAAAAGDPARLSAAAAGDVDADSGVALSTVGTVTAENFGICHRAVARVRQWENWHAEQAASWAKYKGEIGDVGKK